MATKCLGWIACGLLVASCGSSDETIPAGGAGVAGAAGTAGLGGATAAGGAAGSGGATATGGAAGSGGAIAAGGAAGSGGAIAAGGAAGSGGATAAGGASGSGGSPADGGTDAGDAGGNATRVTIVMAADIAEAGRTANARGTAAMIASHVPAVSSVVLGGDNARYGGGSSLLQYYNSYYKPATEGNWGQFDSIAFPQSGNHEYNETNAQGYFDYFATRNATVKTLPTYHGFVDVVGKGYYSFDLNGWHVVSLNSNCSALSGGCTLAGPQETWLKADLTAHPNMPTMAMWHAPRYACGGGHADDGAMQAFWADLYDAKADFVFNGHNHYYQRWKPLNKATPAAALDPQNGLAEIVVGSTGVSPHDVCTTVDPRVAAQKGGEDGMGVFFLAIADDGSYSFEYRLLKDGSLFDSGSGRSHNAR